MILDDDHCYAALISRDSRFDGQFFTAVHTTGIYCRSICPAPKPKRENVTFYPNAAAAAEAGFRPCLRCKPETAPETAATNRSTLLAQALAHIAEGALDHHSVEHLASTLNVSERHLRRVFQQELGASPTTVAQNRRLHLAKQLLDQTTLSIADIAFCAGFGSVRRFNETCQQIYQRAPSELRRRTASKTEMIQLHLSYRPPLDWDLLLGFLARRVMPGVENVDNGVFSRTLKIGDDIGVIRATPQPQKHQLQLCVSPSLVKHLASIITSVRRVFDLNADPAAINNQLATHPRLAPLLAARPGLRVPGAWNAYECMVRAILGQQVSVAAAVTLLGRVVSHVGDDLPADLAQTDHALHQLFPTPEQLAAATLDGLGITQRRIDTLKHFAKAVAAGEIDFNQLTDPQLAEAALVKLPGIGPWTAGYVALRGLKHPDAFPAGDLVLRKMIAPGETWTEKQLLHTAAAWRPWRAYAAVHLWATAP